MVCGGFVNDVLYYLDVGVGGEEKKDWWAWNWSLEESWFGVGEVINRA